MTRVLIVMKLTADFKASVAETIYKQLSYIMQLTLGLSPRANSIFKLIKDIS